MLGAGQQSLLAVVNLGDEVFDRLRDFGDFIVIFNRYYGGNTVRLSVYCLLQIGEAPYDPSVDIIDAGTRNKDRGQHSQNKPGDIFFGPDNQALC
ncbi:hypothetical protein [Kordiimonas aestuarii]|uniref:hypothetical protein n=1 Tax=Kordiimonas aestuarii TaxID=1005925 RepID=UPI0021CFBA98|nr:hypothetical protein [Kordiimonas aestuarii]